MKKNKRINFIWKVLPALLAMILLAGCGEVTNVSHPDLRDSVIIEENGSVIYDFGGDFDEERYVISELVEMAKEQIADFNLEQGSAVASYVGYYEDKSNGRRTYLTYRFRDTAGFEAMTGYKLKYLTAEDYAISEFGFSAGQFRSVKDSSTVKSGSDLLSSGSSKHVIVTDFPGAVMGPYEIGYLSGNARSITTGETTYAVSEDEGTITVILRD